MRKIALLTLLWLHWCWQFALADDLGLGLDNARTSAEIRAIVLEHSDHLAAREGLSRWDALLRLVRTDDGPDAFVNCLGINSTNEELLAMKDAAVGGILAGLGAEGAGSSIFDAFLRGAKIDKCRSDIKTFVGRR